MLNVATVHGLSSCSCSKRSTKKVEGARAVKSRRPCISASYRSLECSTTALNISGTQLLAIDLRSYDLLLALHSCASVESYMRTLPCRKASLHHAIGAPSIIILLLLPVPPLLTPRKVRDGNGKERVRGLRDTGQHVIPSNESGDDAERTASARKRDVWRSVSVEVQVGTAKADEGDPDAEEECVEC